MKASELMIGDWLRTSRGIAKVIAVDKIGLTFKIDGGDFDIDWDDEEEWFNAIPLTPEILGKNGFDKYGENLIYEKDGLYMQIKLGAFVRIFCGMDNSVNFNRDFYVHTLQHALRLCGIEKEITI